MTTRSLAELDRVLGGEAEEKLTTLFYVLYKNARIIEENHPTFKDQCGRFKEQMEQVSEGRQVVTIKVVSGRHFVNGMMVRYDDRGLSGATTIMTEWEHLGLAGLVLSTGLTVEQVGRFFKFMAAIKPVEDNLDELSERLKSHGLPGINLLSVAEADDQLDGDTKAVRLQFRAAARSTFFQAMAGVESLVSSADTDDELNLSKTRQIVHSLIDHITRDASSMIELAAIKDFDDYTYAHSANVCVYALTMGLRLGLDRTRLSQLGFAALFHDIGKVRLSSDLVRKPGAFNEDDWIQMQQHPILGAKLILKHLKLDAHSARAARAAFEHHINLDRTGYPRTTFDTGATNLFSQIVAIADVFDALYSGRVYMKESSTADEAIRKMRYQVGQKYDPLLFRVFSCIVGVYPAGSLVLLSSEEIALVLTNNEDDPVRPYVKIVGDRSGLWQESKWVDLSAEPPDGRRILRSIDPERYGLNVRDFVLSD